jgi:hypothetical protein
MTIKLEHYQSGSVLTLLSGKKHLGTITYTQPSHKYRSESDYKTLVTEDKTYSDSATLELFGYLQATR